MPRRCAHQRPPSFGRGAGQEHNHSDLSTYPRVFLGAEQSAKDEQRDDCRSTDDRGHAGVDGDIGPSFDGSTEKECNPGVFRIDLRSDDQTCSGIVHRGLFGDDDAGTGLIHGRVLGVYEEGAALRDVRGARGDRLCASLTDRDRSGVNVACTTLLNVDNFSADFFLEAFTIDGWENAGAAPNLTLELVRRGYTEEDIAKIWSGNFLRVWREVEEAAGRTPKTSS